MQAKKNNPKETSQQLLSQTKLKRPAFERYSKGDLIQYFNNVLDIISLQQAKAVGIEKQYQAFVNIVARFNANWQPNKGSDITHVIRQLDDKRSRCFIGLSRTFNNWAINHYDDTAKKTAAVLAARIKLKNQHFRTINQEEKTAIINSILTDLKTHFSDEIALLQLTEWVENLQQINNQFNQKYLERTIALSKQKKGIVFQLRNESISCFKSLFQIIKNVWIIAQSTSTPSPILVKIIQELNEITEKYNLAVQKYANNNNTANN